MTGCSHGSDLRIAGDPDLLLAWNYADVKKKDLYSLNCHLDDAVMLRVVVQEDVISPLMTSLFQSFPALPLLVSCLLGCFAFLNKVSGNSFSH
jgi:hypothetical protein